MPSTGSSPPAATEIGLIEGVYVQTQDERARHPFFGDPGAPCRHTNTLTLGKHINKVRLAVSRCFVGY